MHETTTDSELLKVYARNGSETAFRELVSRHTDLVYSTAVRLVVDSHLAEDVSQRVFVALAQNASKLAQRETIGGWLHTTTHNFAVMTIRTEERERARQQKATMMNPDSPDSNSAWEQIAPHLDDALSKLTEADRDVVVLRYFERKSAREMGAQLGLSEEAAQKRTSRALEKLRDVFRARRIVLSATVLASAIPLQAAPAGLGTVLATRALAQIGLSFPSGVAGGANIIAHMKAHPVTAVFLVLACLTLGTTGFVSGRKAAVMHHSAAAWREAMMSVPQSQDTSMRVESPVETEVAQTPQRGSISEILQEAAQHFRSQQTDPDGYAKGIVALDKLRPEEAMEAVRELNGYQNEPGIFNMMAPSIMRLWAQTEPQAALAHALEFLKGNALGASVQGIAGIWAGQDPQAAWGWYREATDSGKTPMGASSWGWVAKFIFTEWAIRDPATAFDQFGKVDFADERAAIFGIAEVVKEAKHRAPVLAAIEKMPDAERRHHLAAEVASKWAEMEPQAAAEWSATLISENPALRLHAMSEAFEEWWRMDPHASAVWVLTQAPGELREHLRNFASPEQFKKLLDAAK